MKRVLGSLARNAFLSFGRAVIPYSVRTAVGRGIQKQGGWKTACMLAGLRSRMYAPPHFRDRTETLFNFTVSFNHGPNFYSVVEDIFVREIYAFEAERPDPLVIDCGANIGGVILYCKQRYPRARVIAFEPDPVLYPYLEKNVAQNDLSDVKLIQAGLSSREGTLPFYSDGIGTSRFSDEQPVGNSKEWTRHEVPCVRLRDYLEGEVDFLKINVEGAEWEVLSDSEDRIKQVRQMAIEYHHMPGTPRTLHNILDLLHRNSFGYCVYNLYQGMDQPTGPRFELSPDARYFLLLFAKRTT